MAQDKWPDGYTTAQLLDMLERDFTLLADDSWVPDRHSCEASLDVVAELQRRVAKLHYAHVDTVTNWGKERTTLLEQIKKLSQSPRWKRATSKDKHLGYVWVSCSGSDSMDLHVSPLFENAWLASNAMHTDMEESVDEKDREHVEFMDTDRGQVLGWIVYDNPHSEGSVIKWELLPLTGDESLQETPADGLPHCEVVVGNIGTVLTDHDVKRAREVYDDYVLQAQSTVGRACGEDVTLIINGEIIAQHVGWLQKSKEIIDE